MNARRIKELFDQYKSYLQSSNKNNRLHYWESQSLFQKHWDVESEDFLQMYDQSLQSSTTQRLWKREAYEPKHMMIEFIRQDPHWARQMFNELFDESKSIEGRTGRFLFYCDLLLENYKKANPASIENNHYHDDGYQIIFLYLSFRYPALYTPYNHDAFVSFLKKVQAVDPPIVPDVERFVKVSRIIFKMMTNDNELMELNQKRLIPEESYTEESMMVVFDFFLALEQMETD